MPRMQFGLQLGQERVTWPQLLEGFQRAEALGFDTLWAHDHFIPADPGQTEGPCMDGWTVLAAVAALPSRVRLGVMVTGVPYRHPAILAKQAVTVDQIS